MASAWPARLRGKASSRMAWLKGTSGAPQMPWIKPEDHHALQIPGHAAQGRGQHEAANGEHQQPPAAEPGGEIAGERHHHGGRDEIGGQDPGDLVGGGAERAQHMRERHVDDGDVEHFEDRGQHDGDHQRDRRTLERFLGGDRAWRRGGRLALASLPAPALGAAHCDPCVASAVSMVTVALAPRRNGLFGSGGVVMRTLTGKR